MKQSEKAKLKELAENAIAYTRTTELPPIQIIVEEPLVRLLALIESFEVEEDEEECECSELVKDEPERVWKCRKCGMVWDTIAEPPKGE